MFRVVASAFIVASFTAPVAIAGQADLILLRGNVLTEDPGRQTVEAVAIAGEQIRAVGSSQEVQRLAGPQTRIVDLRGRTVIPGLIDAHVHLLLAQQIVDEPSLREYERAVLPQTLTGFLEHGVTTVRSPGDPWPYIADVRDRLERGTLAGPRLVIAGPAVTAPGGHPIPTICRDNLFCRARVVREVANEEQARQAVRDLTRMTTVDLDVLTTAEQLDLLERIWERLSRDPANLPLTPEQVRELDDRDDELEADIRSGRPLGEPWSEVRKRFK